MELDPTKQKEICEMLTAEKVDEAVGLIHNLLNEKNIPYLTGLFAMEVMLDTARKEGLHILKETELPTELREQLKNKRKDQTWN